MEKGTQVGQIYEATRRLHDEGIEVGFFIQFGYPGETRTDIQKTFRMVQDCRPDDIGVSVSYPLPGTRFHETVSEHLSAQRNWVDSSDLAMMYRGPFATAFYRQLHTLPHKGFRARKAWEELSRVARQPGALRRHHLRQLAALIYHAVTLPWERIRLEALARVDGHPARRPGGAPARRSRWPTS